MAINDKIWDEKLQYDINREATKIAALSSGKIEKYKFLASKKIITSDQWRLIEQANFTYSPSGKALEKQTKTIEDQIKKQIKAIEIMGKKLAESNVLVKKDFNIERDNMQLEEQKQYSMNILKTGFLNFRI